MANPRKFSEKIALHNQKQAEETAKFEQIMREVSDVTAKPDQQDPNTFMILSNADDVQHTVYSRESRNRSMGVGPMRTRPIDRRIDTSPYSGPYLSPPPDTSWRRTNSDSALHQSAMQGLSDNRSENSGSRWNMNNVEQNDGRPRSSCDVPRVPGINIYPSAQEPGIVQIPIGNNTGSLPDLTSVHFPSPLHTPLDQEQDHSSSPYSSSWCNKINNFQSPVSASPATLSPTSVPTGLRSPQGQTQFHFTNRNISQHHNSNHLSVPGNSRYLHHNKGVTLENSVSGLVDGLNYNQNSVDLTGLQNMYQQQCPTSSPSPTLQQPPQVSAPGYRSPMARPSPQSSPGLGSRHSAPSSPAAPSPIPDCYLNHTQATLLQQHFEQFSMMDSPSPVNYMDGGPTSIQTQTLPDVATLVTSVSNNITDLGNTVDTAYYTTSPSSLMYQTAPTSLHTTPNTPTSIPDIILTDFSNPPDDISRQEFSKELSNVILDDSLFPSDESLREGLCPIDFDGLQMLSDPEMNVISDNAEDHFRLDRL